MISRSLDVVAWIILIVFGVNVGRQRRDPRRHQR